MIRSIRPAPIPLLIAAALCLAVALATFPTAPAHAQSGTPAVSIRTDLTEVSEGRPVVFTLTRTGGDVSSPLTVNVAVDDPGDVMRGDPWEGDPTLPTQAVFEANQSSATLTLATRQNLRDTPDQTLAVSLEEGSGYDVSLPLRASVTVADDDTAPEVSLSVDKTGAVEGDFLTFTLTRHGDTSQAMDSIVLTIGPNRVRRNAVPYLVDHPQDYGATMAPGVATAQVTVQVMEVVTRSPESDFRYQARIKASRPVPGEHESQYFTVRGPRTVGALVTDSTRYPHILITDESDGERWHEGQEVSLSLTRQFADVSEELEVRLLYVEVNHPHRERGNALSSTNFPGNPSVRFLYHTFPAGSDRVDITLTIGTDDVDEWWEEDYIALLVRPVWDVDPYLPAEHLHAEPVYSDGIVQQIFDNPRTVSIAADGTSVDEGEAADFTLTRDGPTAGPLAVNISIEDPGGFLRGNHGQSAPTLVREVIFEAGSAVASLSLPTRDDRRDIADADVTVTVRPTQDGSYEGSYRVVEGSGSASVTVADNDAAPQIELSVDRTEAVEGETVTFRLTRIGDARNSVELPVLFGIDGEQTPTVYGLGPGETTLTRVIQTVDDDFDGPNAVYEATLLPLDGVPEEEQAQYWTVKGPRSVTVTISDNDLPVVGLEAVSESYIENQYGQIRLIRVGQTDRELTVNARVSQSGHDIDQIYAHLIGDRSITIRRSRDARDNLFLLAGDDGDEDDGAITMQLLEGAGYRIDPELSVASFTVIDTDPAPTLSVADATASEGGGTIDFEVSLSSTTNPPSRRTVTVDYATRDGTALAGEDYTTTRGTLTFRPKARSATISVPVLDDRLAERDQTFTLTLSNPRFGEFEDGESSVSATGAIEDDEPIVSIAAADDEVTEGVEVVFTVTRTGATTETLPVKLYIYQTGSPNPVPVIEPLVVFPAGSATADYAVETEDDDLDHGTIVVTASVIDPADRGLTPTYQSAGEFAVVEVRDNDLPIVSIEAVKEGAREGEEAQFVLTREGDLRASLTVYVNVTPEDISLSGAPPATATFGPSASQVNLSAPTAAGSLNQDGAHGRVSMAISSNASYRIGESGSARVVFFDSSYTGPTVSISSNSPVVDEGDDVVFTLTRTGPALLELTARVRVTEVGHNVLRLTDDDLTDESHKIDGHEIVKVEVVDVVFEPGARTATLTRTTEDEALNDGNSTIRAAILLSSDHGILPFPGFKVVWVRDDDIPTVTVTPGSDERPVEECEREGVEGTVPCMVEFRGDKPFTFHRTGDASTLLHVNTDAMSISYFEPPFEDRVVPRRDVGWTAFLPGESSHVRTFTPQLVRPLGAEASVWLVPHYCAEAPGDCGRRPQYHVGTPSSGVLYVYNNEMVVRVEADQSSVTEGETATFTLSRFGGTRTGRVDTKHVRVEVTQNGEFIEGVPPQIVTFWGIPHRSADDAEETKALRIPTSSDLVDEENGAITVRVLPWGDAAPDHDPEDNYQYFYDTLRTPATVTVIDDDLPGISISDATAAEGDGSLEFTVTASGIGQQVTVDWATADGAGANAATAGEDYTAASGALTFAVGETSKTITVTALDDGLDEDNETFTVNLSNPSGAMVTTATGTGTIEDDDDGRVVVTIWTPDDNVMEGQNAVFSLKRWADSSSLPEGFGDFPLTVNLWITQDGDFIADSAPGTVTFPVTATFPAQHMRILLNVPTDDDDKQEDNGSVTVAVADGSGYSAIIGREATVNVTDNDLGIWIADAEPGVEGAGPHIFTVSLSGAYAGTVNVDVSTVDGEATSDDAPTETSLGKDFEAKSETLTFAPGETEKQFAVTSVDDLLDEARESFTVELSNPSANVQLVDAVAAGEIRDNDGKMIVGLHRDTLRVSENQDGPVNFYFELSPAVGSDTSAVEKQTVVRWKVTAGSATPGEDYVEAQGRTVIPLGGLTGVAEVSLLDDDLFEETFETFTFEITSALNLDLDEGKQSIEIRIRDNENMWAEVTAASDSVVEGGDAAFTVSLSRSMNTAPVEVTYTVRGTAGSADYTAPSGTLTIPAGEPSASFRIPTLMDNVLDPDETLEVVLVRAASSGREVPTSGELALTTILDEGTMAASIAQAKATEGEPMEFTISLSVATDVPVKVKWETEDAEGPQGRALENVDYATSEGTVTIPEGQTSGTFTVTTHQDNLAEGNETFRVSLTVAMRGDDPDTAAPVALGVVSAEALILDDDDPPTGVTLTVTPGEVAEGAGETTLTVTATLVGGSVLPGVTPVSLTVKDGAATAGDDYTATTATLTIPAGELSNTATLTLTPVDDNLAEGAETVRVTGRVSGLTVTGAELTITDNDAQPTGVTLTVTPDSIGEGAGETALAVSATLTGGSPRLVDTPVTLSVEGVSLPSEEDGGDPTIAATNADFTANGVTLTIRAGRLTGTGTLTLTPEDDPIAEGDETVQVSGAAEGLDVTPAPLTIEDDDEAPDRIELSVTPETVGEDAGAGEIQVTALFQGGGSRTADTTVSLQVHGVTATAGEDYAAQPDVTLIIRAGHLSGTASLTLTPVNDTIYEGEEQVAIRGTNTDPGLPVSGVRLPITDDDEEPTTIDLSVDKDTVSEDGGSQQLRVTARLQGSSQRSVDTPVRLTLVNGTATNSDYTALPRTVTIRKGKPEGTVTVVLSPTDDSIDEPDETLELRGTTSQSELTASPRQITIIDDDTAGVTVSESALTIEEGGRGTYTVRLDTQPTDSVTVTVNDPANTDVTAEPASLTFSASTWSTAQTVTVSAKQDDDAADDTATVTHTVSGADYGSVSASDVAVTVTDDDDPAVRVSFGASAYSVDEGSGVTVKVQLSADPERTVTIPLSATDRGGASNDDYSGVPDSVVFGSGETEKSFTFTATADEVDDDGESVELSFGTLPDRVTVGSTAASTITITDDDAPAVTVSFEQGAYSVAEGSGVTVKVQLSAGPERTVTIPLSAADRGGASDSDYSGVPASVVFGSGETEKSFTFTATADEVDDDGESVELSFGTLPDRVTVGSTAASTITITDDDAPAVTVSFGASAYSVDEGSGVTVKVQLSADPERTVTIPLSATDRGGASNDDYSGVPDSVVFGSGETEKSFTFTATADEVDDDGESVELSFGTLPDRVTVGSTATSAVSIGDDDTAGVRVSESALTIEEGGDATYTVRLDTQPTDSVTVTVKVPADTDVTAEPASLTFSASTWSTAQTVTVSAKQDDDAIDEEQVTITHTVSGADYGSVSASDVAVTVTDDDDPAVRVNFGASSYSVDEGSGVTVTVALSEDPKREVAVLLTATDRGGASNDDYSGVPDSVVFESGETEKSFTFTATADEVDDDGESVELSFGTLPDRVTAGSTATSAISIGDDDTAGVTVSESALTIEEGGDATYTVRLDTQPTDSVTVTVNDPDNTEVTADPASLTFSTSTWSTAQTVTVSAKQDDDAIDEEQVTITHTVSGADYGSVRASDVAVTVTDDDDPAVRVSFEQGAYSVAEGSGVTVKVQLSAGPERTVTIPLSAADRGGASDSDYSGVPASVVFGSGETEKSFTFTAAADEVDDDGESVELSFGTLPDRVTVGSTATSTVSITDDDTAGVTVSESALTIEEGGDATYTVRLDTQPTDSVTVTVNDPANTEVTAEPASLTFSASTWSTTQTVTVSANQDDDAADDTATVTHTVSGADYGSVSASDVAVTVTDDDDPVVRVSFGASAYSVDEGSGVTVKVQLSADPERTVTIPLSATDRGGASDSDYSGVPASVVFGSGETEKSFTFTAAADEVDDDGESVELSFGTLPDRVTVGSTAASATISITDDDTAGVTVSESALTIEEGGDATYTVRLDTQPTDSVTVTVNDPANTDVTAEPASLTFSASTWSTAQTVTVSAKQDDDAADDTATVTHTVSGADYGSVSASDVAVTVTDDDDPAVRVSFGASAYSVDEGSGVTVTVALSEDPKREVAVLLTATDRGGASNDDYSGVPASVVFESGETEKSFTFTATADEVDDDGESVELSFGTLPDRVTAGSTAASTITITDDDTAGVRVSESALTIEEGGDATYTVRLDTQPTGDVTVTVNDPDNTEVTADPASLTFSTSTWSTAQTVTVSAKQDDDAIDEEQVTITHTVSGADYGSVRASDVAVTVTDDDDPAVRVNFGASSYSVDEGSGVTVTVALSEDPKREVTVLLTATDQGGASNDDYSGVPASVVFESGETEKSFTFTATADEVDDDGESVELSFGTLPDRVTAGSTATSAISIGDDDTAGVTVSESALTIEEGGDATYTVRLDTQPTDSVTVTVKVPADTDVTAEPASLTFSASTWSTAQTVTVSAKQDDDAADDTATVTHTVSGADYGSVRASDVAVTVTDDDDPAVRVNFGASSYSVDEGSGVTVTVALSEDPKREVAVLLTATDRGGASNDDYSGVPDSVVFESGETEKSFTFTATADEVDDDGESVELSFGTLPDRVTAGSTAASTITITDEDAPAVTVSFEQGAYTATEGGDDATVTVYLGNPSPRRVDIPLTAEGHGGATPDDWSDVPTSLTFNAGDTSKSFTVTAINDSVEDDGEMVELGFGALPDGFVAGSQDTARITLMNDEEEQPASDNCDAVWCATVTLVTDHNNEESVVNGSIAWHRLITGSSLSDAEFTYEGEDYPVTLIYVVPDHSLLHLSRFVIKFNTNMPPESHYSGWTMHIGDLAFPFTPERLAGGGFRWRHPEFYGFRSGTTVQLRIEASDNAETVDLGAEATAPSPPRYLSVFPWHFPPHLGLRVHWEGPSFDGAPDVVFNSEVTGVTGYKVQWKEAAGRWDNPVDVSEDTSSATYFTILGLTEGVSYTVRVIAISAVGESPPSEEVSGTPRETAPPELSTAAVDGATLILTYNETLDGNSEPSARAFEVTAAGADLKVDDVSLEGSAVTLTLASAVTSEEQVAVSYINPLFTDVPKLQDAVGNAAPSFIDRSVTNNTPGTSRSTRVEEPQEPPPAPQNLAATVNEDGSVTLTWDAPDDESVAGYRILRRRAAKGEDTLLVYVADTGDAATAFTDTDVTAGTQYIYRVKAINGAGLSEWSNYVNVTPPEPEEAVQNAPATGAPVIFSAAQVGQTLTISTSGIADADGLSNATFSYQWLADGTNIAGATDSTYTLVAADEGKTIRVRVSFTDDGGNEETLTSEATATVAAEPTPLTARFENAPESHNGTDSFAFRIAFSEDIGIGYTTFRDHSLEATGGSVTKAERVNGRNDLWVITVEPDSDADVTVVLPTTEDCDAVGAVCTRAEGGERRPLSSRLELTVTGPEEAEDEPDNQQQQEPQEPPPAPQNLTATVNEDGSVTLTWDAPDDDSVTGYQILRRRPTEGEDTLLVYVEDTGDKATTFTDTNVTAAIRHVYRVKAINGAGLSEWSNYTRAEP